jgi:hypothetical protein
LRITNNDALAELGGLRNLGEVWSQFVLAENDALTSLHALTALSRVGDISILDNSRLPTCEAEWLVARLPSETGSHVMGNDDGGMCKTSRHEPLGR